MTKRLIALVLVVIFSAVALIACSSSDDPKTEPAKKTEAPATSSKTSTPKTNAPETKTNKTAAPETTSNQTDAPVSTEAPGSTEAPVTTEDGGDDEDPYAPWGGLDKMFATGSFYGTNWEVWPWEDNGAWCPHAFFQSCVQVDKSEVDATALIGTDEYEYTWQFFYQDEDTDDYFKFEGPYTADIKTYYDWGNGNVIYRLLVSDMPEGDMTANFEVDHNYNIVVVCKKGDEVLGFAVLTTSWDARYAAFHDAYYHFWNDNNHKRADGFTTGAQTYTDADIQYDATLGFNQAGQWNPVA